jgi:hypothetical protein
MCRIIGISSDDFATNSSKGRRRRQRSEVVLGAGQDEPAGLARIVCNKEGRAHGVENGHRVQTPKARRFAEQESAGRLPGELADGAT